LHSKDCDAGAFFISTEFNCAQVLQFGNQPPDSVKMIAYDY